MENADVVRAALDDLSFAFGQIGDLGDKNFGHALRFP
jgi:hypothetical protein